VHALKPSASGSGADGVRVSSIHSAVRWLELYGTVCENVSFRVASWSVITQTFEFGTVAATETCM
jgi:hypothetical protein